MESQAFAVETTLPGTECDEFAIYAEAVAYADELADEWEEATGQTADRSWASRDNFYAVKCGDYTVAVVRA